MRSSRTFWIVALGMAVRFVMGCGNPASEPGPEEVSSAADSQALAEEAVRQVEEKAAKANVSGLFPCIDQCTQTFWAAMSNSVNLNQVHQLIGELLTCTDKCISAIVPPNPGIPPNPSIPPNPNPPQNNGGQGGSCSSTGSVNGILYEAVCTNGTCSCRKDGVELGICQQASPYVCNMIMANVNGALQIKAACCTF